MSKAPKSKRIDSTRFNLNDTNRTAQDFTNSLNNASSKTQSNDDNLKNSRIAGYIKFAGVTIFLAGLFSNTKIPGRTVPSTSGIIGGGPQPAHHHLSSLARSLFVMRCIGGVLVIGGFLAELYYSEKMQRN